MSCYMHVSSNRVLNLKLLKHHLTLAWIQFPTTAIESAEVTKRAHWQSLRCIAAHLHKDVLYLTLSTLIGHKWLWSHHCQARMSYGEIPADGLKQVGCAGWSDWNIPLSSSDIYSYIQFILIWTTQYMQDSNGTDWNAPNASRVCILLLVRSLPGNYSRCDWCVMSSALTMDCFCCLGNDRPQHWAILSHSSWICRGLGKIGKKQH